MRLPRFEYLEAKSIESALKLLEKYQEEAKVLAGGTDLLPLLKQRAILLSKIINIKAIPGMNDIELDPRGGLIIGSLCTLSNISASQLIWGRFPVLAEAADLVGSSQIRNMATLGGNICLDTRCLYYNQSAFWRKSLGAPCVKFGGNHCHVVRTSDRCQAVYAADMGSVLVALGAEARICSLKGERIVSFLDFFTHDPKAATVLQPNEILTQIRVPPLNHWGGAYLKSRLRGGVDFPSASAATTIELDPNDGKCSSIRVVVGGVAPGPVLVNEAQDILIGKCLEKKLVKLVGESVLKHVRPIDNVGDSPLYRRKVSRTLVERAILKASSSLQN